MRLALTYLLFGLFVLSAEAQGAAQDPVYYPQRLEWHTISELLASDDQQGSQFNLLGLEESVLQLDSRAFIEWDQGQFLSITFDKADIAKNSPLTVWVSRGDGLFMRIQPERDNSGQWLFFRPKAARAVVMLENNGAQNEPINLRLAQSKQSDAPAMNVHSDLILHAEQQVHTERSDGYQHQDFNQLNAQQTLSYTFEGPGEYTLSFRTLWFAEYGLSQLMELQWALDEQEANTEVVKIQPRHEHLLETADGNGVYSRLAQIRVLIPEGEHTVHLRADRNILAYWMRSNQVDQFFYQRNYAVQWARNIEQPQTERLIAAQSNDYHMLRDVDCLQPDHQEHLPAMYFYRQLNPVQASKLTAITPSVLTARQQHASQEYWLPSGHPKPNSSQYFNRLLPNSKADFVIPPSSHHPPLRLYLRSMLHRDVRFSLISDRGEQIKLAYFPSSGLADEMQEALPLILGAEQVAMQIIEFKMPFSHVTLQNNSEHVIDNHLAYKNRSDVTTDEHSFFDQVNTITAPVILAELHEDKPVFSSVLLTAKINQWKRRLSTRYHNFIQRYPVMNEAESQGLESELSRILANVNQLYGSNIQDLDGLINTLEINGSARLANKLLAAFAMLPRGDRQTLAEDRFLTLLAMQERWYDIEGYWAYRFIVDKESQAIVELVQVMFRQNDFILASQLFWLAYQGQLLPRVPEEALMASVKSTYSGLPGRWMVLLEKPAPSLSESWRYWTIANSNEIDGGIRTSIHNRGFDSYFSAFKLEAKKAKTFTFQGPVRLKLTVYGQRNSKDQAQPNWPAVDFLTVGEHRYLLSGMADSLNLTVATDATIQLAGPKSVVIDLPEGEHDLAITLAHQDALVNWHQEVNLMNDLAAEQIVSEPSTQAPHELLNHRLLPTPALENTDGLLAALGSLLLKSEMLKPKPLSNQDISKANHLAQGVLLSPTAREWLAAINQDQGWHRQQSVVSSAGHQTQTQTIWQPSSPYLQLQRALLLERPAVGERLLSASTTQVIEVDRPSKSTLTVKLRQIHRYGDVRMPAQVMLQLDGQPPLATATTHTFELSPGRHQISLSLLKDDTRPWVFFSVTDLPPLKTLYDMATPSQPLVIFVPAGSWLRIDEVIANKPVSHQKRYIEQAQSLTLLPSDGASASLYRVYKWGPNAAQETVHKALPDKQLLPAWPNISAHHTYWLPSNPGDWLNYDKYPRNEQHDGTWGISADYRIRQNFDEDVQNQDERFLALGWQYRRNVPDWQSHFRSKIAIRVHEETSLETLVNENDWVYRPSRYWDVSAQLNAYYQYKARQQTIRGGVAVFSSISGGWQKYWQDNIDNKLSLTVFARSLSLNSAEVFSEQDNEQLFAMDDDVYSAYKAQHRRGLRLSDTWQYHPWLDTRLRLQAGLTSNEDWDLTSPDRLYISVGLWQYWRPLTLKLELQHRRFKKDENRNNSFGRTTAKLDIQWQRWNRLGQLWRIDSFFQYDIDNREPSFGLSLSWNQSHGQGFDDFAPSRLSFGSLKRRYSYHVIESNQVVSEHE